MRTPTHLFLAALTATGAAHAQYFEARNSAMGGVGTASSNYLAAGWGNPALLTSCDESDDFGLILRRGKPEQHLSSHGIHGRWGTQMGAAGGRAAGRRACAGLRLRGSSTSNAGRAPL